MGVSTDQMPSFILRHKVEGTGTPSNSSHRSLADLYNFMYDKFNGGGGAESQERLGVLEPDYQQLIGDRVQAKAGYTRRTILLKIQTTDEEPGKRRG